MAETETEEGAEVVLYERRGATAVVTMNRPRYRNAQNARMTHALDAAFTRAVADDEVKVIVLAGAGKHFSAGHDIGTPGRDIHKPFPRVATMYWEHADREGAEGMFVREQELYLGMCRRWREIPKPTVAMVQGACVAGGLMLAWACDLILAAEDAFFADPVVKMGIPGVEYFAHAHVMGPRLAKEFLFLGERIGANRALAIGMINRVFPAGRAGARDARPRCPHRRDAALRAGARQEGRQPGRGPHGPPRHDGRDVRAPPPRARAQRADVHRPPRRPGREEHGPVREESSARRREVSGMDLRESPREADFRREARAWLEANVPRTPLPSGDTAEGFALHVQWEKKLFDARWAVVSWPRAYGGREASLVEWLIFEEEYYRAGAPQRVSQNGIFLLAPTLFEFGTPGAAGSHPAAHGRRRGPLGPGLVRAQRRAATSPASRASPCATRRPAASASAGRRRGAPAAPSAPTSSASSAPIPPPSATRA